MNLAMLDIDGYRIDKGLTITVDAQAHWSNSIRACAKRFGKKNFYISGTFISNINLCKHAAEYDGKTWEEKSPPCL